MSDLAPTRVVYDCNVLAQALINPKGPAGACVDAARYGSVKLFISEAILSEVRDLPLKLPRRLGVSDRRVQRFLGDLDRFCEKVVTVPAWFIYPRDPDDAHYVNLACAVGAKLVVSRDRDLLDLMEDRSPEGKALRERYPGFRVLDPLTFLRDLVVG